jgi:hypothetical protein
MMAERSMLRAARRVNDPAAPRLLVLVLPPYGPVKLPA